MEFSKQIKKYRLDSKLSQDELAEKVYVTRQTISNWENGKNYPDVKSLLLLSTLFHISLDTLVKGDLEEMREQIKKVLEENYPEIDFESSNELVDDGILDSLTMVGIISALSMEFGVMLPYEDIIPENFNSIDAMAELIEKYS